MQAFEELGWDWIIPEKKLVKKTKVSHSMGFILNACGLSLVQYRPSLSAKTLLAWTSATDGAPASSSEVLYCQWNLWGLMVKILYAICPFCHQPTMSKLWRSKQWTTNDIQGRAQDSSWGKTEGPKAKSGDGVLGEGAATHSLPVNEPGGAPRAPIEGFEAQPWPPISFPLFSPLRMASPDTVILLIVDYNAAIRQGQDPRPVYTPSDIRKHVKGVSSTIWLLTSVSDPAFAQDSSAYTYTRHHGRHLSSPHPPTSA